MGVASASGSVFGSAFFKRESVDEKALKVPVLPDVFPIIAKASEKNLKYAKANHIEVSSQDKSLDGKAIYMANREKFRKGLKKAVKMAKFWSRGALRHQDRRAAQGKEIQFNLDNIELEFDIYLNGSIGAATLEGAGEIELFLDRQD
jgi:hypothetical protein